MDFLEGVRDFRIIGYPRVWYMVKCRDSNDGLWYRSQITGLTQNIEHLQGEGCQHSRIPLCTYVYISMSTCCDYNEHVRYLITSDPLKWRRKVGTRAT